MVFDKTEKFGVVRKSFLGFTLYKETLKIDIQRAHREDFFVGSFPEVRRIIKHVVL